MLERSIHQEDNNPKGVSTKRVAKCEAKIYKTKRRNRQI